MVGQQKRTHLHATDTDAEVVAGRLGALLRLTLLLLLGRENAVLPRAHLQVEDTRLLEAARQIFHQDELLLARGRFGAVRRGRRARRFRRHGRLRRGRVTGALAWRSLFARTCTRAVGIESSKVALDRRRRSRGADVVHRKHVVVGRAELANSRMHDSRVRDLAGVFDGLVLRRRLGRRVEFRRIGTLLRPDPRQFGRHQRAVVVLLGCSIIDRLPFGQVLQARAKVDIAVCAAHLSAARLPSAATLAKLRRAEYLPQDLLAELGVDARRPRATDARSIAGDTSRRAGVRLSTRLNARPHR